MRFDMKPFLVAQVFVELVFSRLVRTATLCFQFVSPALHRKGSPPTHRMACRPRVPKWGRIHVVRRVPLIKYVAFFDKIIHLFGSKMNPEEELLETKLNSLCAKFPRGSAVKVVVCGSRSGLPLGSIHRVEEHYATCGHDISRFFVVVFSAGKPVKLQPWEVELAEM
jgi:hypothetical protein